MSSLQLIHRRIKSIRNTRQITKAMELVAASKMRRAQAETLQSRAYSSESLIMIRTLSDKIDQSIHPLLAHRRIDHILLIVVTSDRGLAGAYNSILIRQIVKYLLENSGKKFSLVTIGKKGRDVLARLAGEANGINIVASYTNFPPHPIWSDITPIAKMAIDGFSSSQYDSVQIAYTHFHSTVKQEPKIDQLLPLSNSINNQQPTAKNHFDYQFEPTPDMIFDFILPRTIEVQIYQRVLEAIASEHSARMVAMKNASDNASEIIDDLRLTYNSVRQAKITQDLMEISQGFV